jgi:iron(III) transport system ATP-binding protein
MGSPVESTFVMPATAKAVAGITAAPMLEVDGLTVNYGDRPVVESLSLRVADGEIGCVVGASGCGKTTLLRAIAGLVPAQRGTIRIGGTLMSGARVHVPPERRGVGLVFQDYALFPHLRVEENIAFGLRRLAPADRRARVDTLIELVGLQALARRYPHELSGGQQQRVALARALAPQPRLVLMDEPFSSLDVELRAHLSAEVRAILKRNGTAAVLVTHDQQEAFAVADAIGVMRAGCLQQWDRPYAVYHRPATRYVADFIGLGVFLPARRDGAHAVTTELGTLACRDGSAAVDAPGAGPADDAVEVLLRPDDIVHDDASPLRAWVLSKAFRGADFLYTLRLASGQQVLALVPSHHDHPIGEPIGIRLEVDHVVTFVPAGRSADPVAGR